MKENRLHYNYSTDVCERYDLTKEEASEILKEQFITAQKNGYSIILTGKWSEDKPFFEAHTFNPSKHDYVWIHLCAQKLLNFDDDTPQDKLFYIITLTNAEL